MPLKIPQLFLSMSLSLAAGFIGSYFTVSAIPTWYVTLNKPSFSPPNWVFGPVWTALYILMGISFYLVWISRKKAKQKAIKLFLIQLTLNAAWSIIFFGMKNPALALIDVIALWVTIILTIKYFYPITRTATYLLTPYLLWVSFASILNLMIWLLNQ